MAKFILLILCNSLLLFSSHAQCPDEKFLHNRLDYSYNSKLSDKDELAELLKFLYSMKVCPYRNDSTHVLLLRKIAWEYSKIGDHLKAVEYVQDALQIVRSNIDKPNIIPGDIILIYINLSNFYDSLGYVREKQAAMDSCINIGIRLKLYSNNYFIWALNKIVQFNYDIGDYHRCIENAIVCERLAAQYFNRTNPIDHNFGKILSSNSLAWHIKALFQIKEYDEAKKLIAHKLEEYKKTGLTNYLGFMYSQEAELEIHQRNYQHALELLKRSYSCDQEAENFFNCKQTLKDIGYKIYFEQFNDDAALFYYRKALAYSGRDKREPGKKDTIESLDIMTNIAMIYVQKNQYDSAFKYFQLAFDQFRTGGNETDILHATPEKLKEIKKIDYVIRLVNSKGDAYMKKYQSSKDIHDLNYSIRVDKVMDSLLDRIKAEQIEIESKLFWRTTTRQMYEHAIEACYLTGDLENAFYFFEKSRAVILNDLLTEQRGQSNNDMLELSRARKKVSMLEREIQKIDSSSDAATEKQKELLDSRHRLDQLMQTIKEKNPIYYQNFLDPNQTTLKDIDKKILNDHQALLEIYEGEHAVYSLLVTRQHTYFNKIDKDDYDRSARLYLSFLSNPDLLNGHVTEFERTAHHLYEMIFKNSAIPEGRIIISPDGAYFPFEALVTDNRKPGSPVYFIQDHAVSYTYSARYLMNDFKNNENKTNGSVLGIAPVHYSYAASLDPLIGSDLSLNKVESYFDKGQTLVEKNATRNNFLQQFSNYSVIQLYTHASDSSDRKEPVIYFSDSSLYLSELIQESKPSTKLAVISACNTGNGKLYLGEGIFSFNRAFATVGIPASVINLWSIDSKSTYQLTELFYKYLSTGMTTDRALQSAKLEFIRNADRKQTLPYYWAPAILIGKTEVIDFNRLIPLKTWVISVAILVFLFLMWWFWKKRGTFRPRIPHQSDLLLKTGKE
jgi:CHAT domain-containing protein/tetratricopeptide (TPR) repeat protein